jgi:hypothetical protein
VRYDKTTTLTLTSTQTGKTSISQGIDEFPKRSSSAAP